MRTSGWLNMRVRCHVLSWRTEMVSDTTRLPGAPEWRIPSHKQPQPSGHFVNLGWDSRRPTIYGVVGLTCCGTGPGPRYRCV